MIFWNKMWCLVVFLVLFSACAGPPPAPVVDRSSASSDFSIKPNAHYRVQRGDSLHAIAFKFGLDWRDIARLNSIAPPYVIHPDQLVRLTASAPASYSSDTRTPEPASTSATVQTRPASVPAGTTTRSVSTPRATTTTVDANASKPTPNTKVETKTPEPVVQPKSEPAVAKGTKAPAGKQYSTPAGDPDRWIWPADGKLISTFKANDPARKGIDIRNKVGQPVVASAGGLVVYSGSGMIGYGELIIIKHSDRMLSAYAHNKSRLVSEGDEVTAGSQIAEMGTNDRNQSVLHFEIRVNGVPVDPTRHLPRR